MSCETLNIKSGQSNCEQQLGAMDKVIVTWRGNSFSSVTDAATLASWETKLYANGDDRALPFPAIHNIEDGSEEDVVDTGSTGASIDVRDGRPQVTLRLQLQGLKDHQQLRKLNELNDKLAYFQVRKNGYIVGYKDANGEVKPIPLSYFKTQKRAYSAGDTAELTSVVLQEASARYYNDLGIAIKPDDFDANSDLAGVIPVTFSQVGDVGSASIEVSVSSYQSEADNVAGAPISGLAASDFYAQEADGTTIVIDTVTEDTNTPGTYDIALATDTFEATDVVGINNPVTTSKPYEQEEALTLTA